MGNTRVIVNFCVHYKIAMSVGGHLTYRRHFGKKRKRVSRNVYFSDVVVRNNKACGGGGSSSLSAVFVQIIM